MTTPQDHDVASLGRRGSVAVTWNFELFSASQHIQSRLLDEFNIGHRVWGFGGLGVWGFGVGVGGLGGWREVKFRYKSGPLKTTPCCCCYFGDAHHPNWRLWVTRPAQRNRPLPQGQRWMAPATLPEARKCALRSDGGKLKRKRGTG